MTRGNSHGFCWLLLVASIVCLHQLVESFSIAIHRTSTARGRSTSGFYSSSSTDAGESSTSPLQEASLRSVTFCNIPKDQEPDLLCDFLLEIGACSAALIDSDRGTPLEQPIFGEPTANGENYPWQDNSPGTVPVWNRCNVTAHFPVSVDLIGLVKLIQDTFPEHILVPPCVTVLPDKDWVVHVQQQWTPIVVGNRFVLSFPWHTQAHVEQAIQKEQQQKSSASPDRPLIELRLQGGIAFGTGEHPTTQLCLNWLDRVITNHPFLEADTSSDDNVDDRILSVLDYGCGSGVLGMAACAMAPSRVQAVGIDIDLDACQIANANARQNNVNMKSYLPPFFLDDTQKDNNDESKSLLLKAYANAQKQLAERKDMSQGNINILMLPPPLQQQQYDVVVANILAGPLVSLAPTLFTMTKPGGFLGMSGILPPQDDMIVKAYRQAGFEQVQVEDELNGWILVTGRRPKES